MIGKGTSCFNIFKCGRNLFDQLDVTYQREFMASPVQEGLYQPSPARERYYDKMAESLIKAKVGSDGTIKIISLTSQSLNLNLKRKQGMNVTYLI